MKSLINQENNYLNAWFAGCFNLSGCMFIGKEKSKVHKKWTSYRAAVSITTNEEEILKLFLKEVGGRIDRLKDKNKDYRWIAHSENILPFLGIIEPYLVGKNVIKKIKVMKSFLRFQENHYKCRLKHINKTREKFFKQMRRLTTKKRLKA